MIMIIPFRTHLFGVSGCLRERAAGFFCALYLHSCKLLVVFAAIAALAVPAAYAETVLTSDGNLSVGLPDGWKATVKEDDRDTVLYVKSPGLEFSIKTLNQEIGERYIQARLKDDIHTLRERGYIASGSIESVPIRSGVALYHTSYSIGDRSVKTGYFTYDGNTYSVLAGGVGARDFESIVNSIRKAGEPIPASSRYKRQGKHRDFVGDESDGSIVVSSSPPVARILRPVNTLPAGDSMRRWAAMYGRAADVGSRPAASSSTFAMPLLPPLTITMSTSTQNAVPAVAPSQPLAPLNPRRPFPVWLWVLAVVLWFIMAQMSYIYAGKMSYPKLAPLPPDVPPDFFFPFLINRFVQPMSVEYSVSSRLGQKVFARYERGGEMILVFSVYGLIITHLVLSLSVPLGAYAQLVSAVAQLPGGRLLVSKPELPFIALFAIAMLMRLSASHRLELCDSGGTPILTANSVEEGIIIRSGNGRDCGRIKHAGGRNWLYCDSDNVPVFEIKDEHPEITPLRKLCGSLSGRLNARYGIFVGDRRAGFILNDPSSQNRFQIHFEYNYARLAPPTHILLAVLYVNARSRDYPYPWVG